MTLKTLGHASKNQDARLKKYPSKEDKSLKYVYTSHNDQNILYSLKHMTYHRICNEHRGEIEYYVRYLNLKLLLSLFFINRTGLLVLCLLCIIFSLVPNCEIVSE